MGKRRHRRRSPSWAALAALAGGIAFLIVARLVGLDPATAGHYLTVVSTLL